MTRIELIRELEARASRELTKDCANDLVLEISAHLDQAVQARVELGQSTETAEAEAVAAIGSPRKLIRELKQANPRSARAAWVDRGVLCAMLAGHIVTAGFVVLSFGVADTRSLDPRLIWGIVACWLFAASWRPRRLQIVPAIALLLPAIVFTAIGLSFVRYADPGFNTYVGTAKRDIPRLIDEAKQRARKYQVANMTFDKEFETYLSGISDGTIVDEQVLMAPRWIATYARYDMYRFDNADAARSAWVKASGQVHEFNSVNQRGAIEFAHRLEEVSSRPAIINWVLHLPSGAYFARGYALFMLGINAIAWLIRSIYETIRRPWRRWLT